MDHEGKKKKKRPGQRKGRLERRPGGSQDQKKNKVLEKESAAPGRRLGASFWKGGKSLQLQRKGTARSKKKKKLGQISAPKPEWRKGKTPSTFGGGLGGWWGGEILGNSWAN